MRGPILETPRLYLRLMESSDFDELLRIFGDEKVMASFNTGPFTPQQMNHWIQRNLAHQEKLGFGLYSVILKANETLIGDCGLEQMELEGETVTELGYDFRSDYWNQGFATEAAIAVRDYAFILLHIPRLISLIRVGNNASRRVAEKIGMQFVNEFTLNGISYWKYSIESKPSNL